MNLHTAVMISANYFWLVLQNKTLMFPAASPYQSRLQALTDHVFLTIFILSSFLCIFCYLMQIYAKLVFVSVWSILSSTCNEVVTGDAINWFNHICFMYKVRT